MPLRGIPLPKKIQRICCEKTKDFYFYFFFDFLTLKFALFYNSQNRICLAKRVWKRVWKITNAHILRAIGLTSIVRDAVETNDRTCPLSFVIKDPVFIRNVVNLRD